MAGKFNFRLLTGTDPQAQYDAIATKDALTFYLLNTGVGYLGEQILFDAHEKPELVTNMLAEGYTGDDETMASTKAIVDLVSSKVNDVAGALNISFFRHVESHTITAEDLENEAISVPAGTQVGDVGLLFTADNDNEDNDGETYYFISLVDYLNAVYSVESTDSITMTMGSDNKITAELKVKEGETSLVVDADGVHIEKTDAINEESASAAKLVTEAALVAYIENSVMVAVNEAITEAMADVVTYTNDDGAEA